MSSKEKPGTADGGFSGLVHGARESSRKSKKGLLERLRGFLTWLRLARPRPGQDESARAFRAGEADYVRLIENMRDALMIDDVDGNVVWANNRFHELFGIPPEDLNQITLSDYVAPEYRAALSERHADRMAGIDVPTLFEYEGLRKDGTRIWVEVQVTEVRRHGALHGTQSVIRDITARKRLEEALQESEARFRQIVETSEEGIWTIDGDARTTFVNPKMARMLGYTPEEMLGKRLHGFAAEGWDARADEGLDRRRRGIAEHHDFAFRRQDGSQLWASLATSPIHDQAGTYVGALAMVTDMTDRKAMELELAATEERWKLALEAVGAGVYDCDLEKRFVSRSPRWKELLGFADHEIGNREDEFYQRIHPDDLHRVVDEATAYLARDTPYQNQYRMLHRDGTWRWILDRGKVVSRNSEGNALRIVGTFADITQQKESEELSWRQANFDRLTGLANRYMFDDRLERDLKNTRRAGNSLALLLIDLDGFKEVNDSLGHDSGDMLLVETARRLRASVRETDTVVRFGGDEFAIILPALKSLQALDRILQALVARLAAPYKLSDHEASISASIGVSLFPDDAADAAQLLKHADRAMYAAKSAGRNRFKYYTPALQKESQDRRKLSRDLAEALSKKQFRMYYQPIVELKTKRIRNAEALIRWEHPTRGLICPADFIPIAEMSELISAIGDWVFEECAAYVKRLRSLHDSEFRVFVNTSPIQLRGNIKLSEHWISRLDAMRIPGQSMVIEIDEGLLVDVTPEVTENLLALRGVDLRVSIQDFGHRATSISLLRELDVDFLSISRVIVSSLETDENARALCGAIVEMGHKLCRTVTAVGVETKEQRDLLAAAGCDLAQGEFFSPPVPEDAFESLVRGNLREVGTGV